MLLVSLIVLFALLSRASRVLSSENPVSNLLRDIAESRRRAWRNADAFGRERMVRMECRWRIIGRTAIAAILLSGAFATASLVLAIACTVTAWRVIQPTRQEMRNACSYRSTGTNDEPPYMF